MPSNGPAPIGRKPPASPAPPPPPPPLGWGLEHYANGWRVPPPASPIRPRESIIITYTGGADSTEHVEIFEEQRGKEPIRGISQMSVDCGPPHKPYADGIIRHATGPPAETIQSSYADEVARVRNRYPQGRLRSDVSSSNAMDDDSLLHVIGVSHWRFGAITFLVGALIGFIARTFF